MNNKPMSKYTEEEEKEILGTDPFYGDFTNTVMLSDKIVTNRKSYDCIYCDGVSQKGEQSRVVTERDVDNGGKIVTTRHCKNCCDEILEENGE